MDKLAEAIARQYKRQQELLTERNGCLTILADSLKDKIPNNLGWYLTDSIHKYYQPALAEASSAIKTLEGLRDEAV